jgi:hypothetical protein
MADETLPKSPDENVSPWASLIGEVYTTHQMRIILGVSATELTELARQRRILALQTADGHTVYPTLQFRGSKVLPGLAEALGAIDPAGIDEWSVVSFLVGKIPRATWGDEHQSSGWLGAEIRPQPWLSLRSARRGGCYDPTADNG